MHGQNLMKAYNSQMGIKPFLKVSKISYYLHFYITVSRIKPHDSIQMSVHFFKSYGGLQLN